MKGLYPFQTIELGNTTIAKTTFERWCETMMMSDGRYSPYSYDLLTRNCNHFCHEALSVLGVDQSQFPAWILDVPQRFLSSPMGQMVRPMLENMQMTAPPVVMMGTRPNPWATAAATATTTTTPPIAPLGGPPPTPTTTPANTKNVAVVVVSATPSTTTATSGTTTVASDATRSAKTTSALDALTQPLLSNNTQTVRLCVTKITDVLVPMYEEEENAATDAYSLLKVFAEDIEKGVDTKLMAQYQPELCNIIQWVLEQNIQTTFALMLARIVVLHGRTSSSSQPILEWIRDHYGILSGNAKVTAWLVIGNILGRRCHDQPPPPLSPPPFPLVAVGVVVVDDWILEKAVADLSHENVAVRQAVAAVLYNASLLLSKSSNSNSNNNNNNDDGENEQVLHDSTVSILCVLFEDETDATTRERRYMAAGKWLRASPAARTLARELGLADHLLSMTTTAGTGQRSPLVDDIVALLMP
jgi:PPPDE putative peptidase domain